MSADNLKKEQFGISNEKQKNYLGNLCLFLILYVGNMLINAVNLFLFPTEIENQQLKSELTERITQLHSHKVCYVQLLPT
jgi:hypothetical protein